MNFRDINALVTQRQTEIRDAAAYAKDTVYGTVAPLWKDMFAQRANFLSAEQFHTFRHPSSEAIVGVGAQKEQDEMSALEEQSFSSVADAHNIPDDVIAKITEPAIGAPPVHPYRGNLFSSVFLHNIPPVWRVVQAAKQFGPVGRPLRICETGAGFGGGASILHQLLDVESYTVIDLPENLYLSSLFLPIALGRTHCMIDPRKPESLACGAQLNFTLASFTDDLTAPPFDLIWNRASMGEMPRATAAAYVAWIKTHPRRHLLLRQPLQRTQNRRRRSAQRLRPTALRYSRDYADGAYATTRQSNSYRDCCYYTIRRAAHAPRLFRYYRRSHCLRFRSPDHEIAGGRDQRHHPRRHRPPCSMS